MKRSITLTLLFLGILSTAFGQPSYDDCEMAEHLGIAPLSCPITSVYTNEDATATVLPFDNVPTCYSNIPDRDVWFTFNTPNAGDIVDFTIQLISNMDNGNGIQNPQVALYREDGGCGTLAELACLSSQDGSTSLAMDVLGLTPGLTYYLRVGDFSASASPNSGEFNLCITEFIPEFNLCEGATMTTSCFGSILDSGGSDGDYSPNENCTFTICPSLFSNCINLDLESYNFEFEQDELNIFSGMDTSGEQIASLTGSSLGGGFTVGTANSCVTLQFVSDFSVQEEGFSLDFSCTPSECNSSMDDVTVINSLPFNQDGFTTCDNDATFATTACGFQQGLSGPEAVFAIEIAESDPFNCYSIEATGALDGTAIAVTFGLPNGIDSDCLGSSNSSSITNLQFIAPGTYYVVVANPNGCTDFDLNIQIVPCNLDPSLENAIDNPINGCGEDGVPTEFCLNTEGFVDEYFIPGANEGCWGGPGATNFFWFSMVAQEDGPFSFIFSATDPAEASDIDFNIWGPFTQDQTANDPDTIIEVITTTQPIRSSWSGGTEPTGIIDVSPLTGVEQTGPYDCDEQGASLNDDFVQWIECTEGEVYIVLINDWGGNIESGKVTLDFTNSTDGLIDGISETLELTIDDAEVCQGQSAQLEIVDQVNQVFWSPAGSLSCNTCVDPIASPTETTEYIAIVPGVCINAEGSVTVFVYNVDAGPNQTVCLGEQVEIVSGYEYEEGNYVWTDPQGSSLSCTDCATPTITALTPGEYNYTVTLTTNDCVISDDVIITVTEEQAAQYNISEDQYLCQGSQFNLGGPAFPNISYQWTVEPAEADLNFPSTDPNPVASPNQTAIYRLVASHDVSGCLHPSMDSVIAIVDELFDITTVDNLGICLDDSVILSELEAEDDVSYLWIPDIGVEDPSDPNSIVTPEETTTYTLNGSRGVCVDEAQVEVIVTQLDIEINSPEPDTVGICLGEQVSILTSLIPTDIDIIWNPTVGLIIQGQDVFASPVMSTLYYATVSVPGCVKHDSIMVLVDSLPIDLSIMPQDTIVCEGDPPVIFSSPIFNPNLFESIEHQWSPDNGFESPDDSYNMVITPEGTTTYTRVTTNGFCTSTEDVTLTVQISSAIPVMPVDPIICQGDTVFIAVDSISVTEEVTYEWESDQDSDLEFLSCNDCLDPIFVGAQAGLFEYRLNGFYEGLDCPDEGEITISVLGTPIAPSGASYCEAQMIDVNNGGSTDPEFTFTWEEIDGDFTSNDAEPTFNLTQNTSFNYFIQNGDCDPIEGTITFTIADQEFVVIAGEPNICNGDNTILTAETDSGSGSFLWSTSETTVSISVSETGTYSVTYTPNPEVCPEINFNAEFVLNVRPIPNIDNITIEPDSCIFEGSPVILTASVSNPGSSPTYTWSDENGDIGNNSSITVAAPVLDFDRGNDDFNETMDYQYTFTVTNEFGCEDESTVDICIQETNVQIPNIFTPNDDILNNVFTPIFNGNLEISQFHIYNRWGQKVYDYSEDSKDGWDGMLDEKPAPADVYAYSIIFKNIENGQEEKWQGDITLLR